MGLFLNPDLELRIAAKVQSGRYSSPSEVIQKSLDLLEERDALSQMASPEDAGSISAIFVRLGRQIPDEELAKIPTDLSHNLDHYLYGSPKDPE